MAAKSTAIEPVAYPGLPELATRPQLAEYLGISVSTLASWAVAGKGPKFIHLGKHVRYPRHLVEQYIADQSVSA